MTSKELDNLVKVGRLKEHGDENELLLESGRKQALAPDSRFDLAYNPALALSLAALRPGFVLSSPTARRRADGHACKGRMR